MGPQPTSTCFFHILLHIYVWLCLQYFGYHVKGEIRRSLKLECKCQRCSISDSYMNYETFCVPKMHVLLLVIIQLVQTCSAQFQGKYFIMKFGYFHGKVIRFLKQNKTKNWEKNSQIAPLWGEVHISALTTGPFQLLSICFALPCLLGFRPILKKKSKCLPNLWISERLKMNFTC